MWGMSTHPAAQRRMMADMNASDNPDGDVPPPDGRPDDDVLIDADDYARMTGESLATTLNIDG